MITSLMSSIKIQGNNLPNMPWQDRPAGCNDPLWRYSANPVIPRDLLPDSNSIFNSAVVPFEGGFAGVFRCDDKNRRMTLHAGFSKDGFKWDINPETIKFEGADPEIGEWVYGYDPRVAIYYGCADTVTGLAFGYIPEIIEFTKRTNIL